MTADEVRKAAHDRARELAAAADRLAAEVAHAADPLSGLTPDQAIEDIDRCCGEVSEAIGAFIADLAPLVDLLRRPPLVCVGSELPCGDDPVVVP